MESHDKNVVAMKIAFITLETQIKQNALKEKWKELFTWNRIVDSIFSSVT